MGITSGFGTTIDLERGTSRQWVMGEDGVKRWVDNGEVVQPESKTKDPIVFDCNFRIKEWLP